MIFLFSKTIIIMLNLFNAIILTLYCHTINIIQTNALSSLFKIDEGKKPEIEVFLFRWLL